LHLCWRIEAAFCRLKDFRRTATRYDFAKIEQPPMAQMLARMARRTRPAHT
jgi:hypothetical protein